MGVTWKKKTWLINRQLGASCIQKRRDSDVEVVAEAEEHYIRIDLAKFSEIFSYFRMNIKIIELEKLNVI